MSNIKYAFDKSMTTRINAVSEVQALAREMSSHAKGDPSAYFDLMVENWGDEYNDEGEVLEMTDDIDYMKQIFVDEIVSIYP